MIEGLRCVIPLGRAIANVPDAEAWPNPHHPSTSGYPPAQAEFPPGKTNLPRRSLSLSGPPEARRTLPAIDMERYGRISGMDRSFDIEVLAAPGCGGDLRRGLAD